MLSSVKTSSQKGSSVAARGGNTRRSLPPAPSHRERKGKPDFCARREAIRAIVVEEGVSEVGDAWFNYLAEVREISLPTTLRRTYNDITMTIMMRGERQRVGDGTSGMGTFAIYILRLQRYWQLFFLPPIKNAVMIKIHFFILHISQISLLPDLEKKSMPRVPPQG